MDPDPALTTSFIIGVCIAIIIVVVFITFQSVSLSDDSFVPIWELDAYNEQQAIEKILCLEYGGIWVNNSCDDSGSVAKMPANLQVEWSKLGTQLVVTGYGTTGEYKCKENYLLIRNTFGGISLPTCIKASYYESASCTDNERIIWNTFGFICHPLSSDQLILKNQEKIIKLLEDDLK